MTSHNIDLEENEATILETSARIFSAYLSRPDYSSKDEETLFNHSIDLAIRMAKEVDRRVSTGEEVRSSLSNDPEYRPLG
ncbi:MAG: hypothetical protein MK193_09810 [Lentisphaeria bacterium]|nr:hypothetical protein [Lentisphaeria bacterium]